MVVILITSDKKHCNKYFSRFQINCSAFILFFVFYNNWSIKKGCILCLFWWVYFFTVLFSWKHLGLFFIHGDNTVCHGRGTKHAGCQNIPFRMGCYTPPPPSSLPPPPCRRHKSPNVSWRLMNHLLLKIAKEGAARARISVTSAP